MIEFIDWIIKTWQARMGRARLKRFARRLVKSQKKVEKRIEKFAEFRGITLGFSEEGFLTHKSRDIVVERYWAETKDPIVTSEFQFGVECKLWSDRQWANAFEKFFPDMESDVVRFQGICKIFAQARLIKNLTELYVRNPKLLSPFVHGFLETAINLAKDINPNEREPYQSLMLQIFEKELSRVENN